MTPAVLSLVEKLRASGELFGNFAFVVASDIALEAGCRLRVTSNRTVPIRKSNRPPRSLFGFDSAYPAWSGDATPTPSLTLATLKRALATARGRPRQMEIRQSGPEFFQFAPSQLRMPGGFTYFGMDALSPENGFTYAGHEWDSDRIFREMLDDDRQDTASARSLVAVINAPPTIRRRGWTMDPREWMVDPAAPVTVVTQSTTAPMARGAKPSRVPEKLQRKRLDGRRR